ncbi:MAG TPA: protein kinase [Bryobacteraceae bacterium]|nr:protein kinase [Bryobacteraceae bacterium]
MNLRGKPGFFWFALAAGILLSACFVFESVNLFRLGRWQKVVGWRAAPVASGWAVAQVDHDGPADGKLRPGDRLLAIDGDTRVSRTGPLFRLTDAPPDRAYDVTIQRQGQRLTVPLRFLVRPDESFLAWGPLFLLVALAFLGTGLLIGLFRPADDTGRYGFGVSMLLAMFMLWVASNPLGGMLQGFALWVSLALSSVQPLHVLFSYLFFAAFPASAPERGGWRVLRIALFALAVVLWAPATLVNLVHAMGSGVASTVIFDHYQAYAFSTSVLGSAQLFFLAVALVSVLAVGWRNYSRLMEGDLRRRLRWVAWGTLAGALPSVAVQVIWGMLKAAGVDQEWVGFITVGTRISNFMVVIMPVTMGYAILKHRVLGMRVALRLGLQYLLATNVLRIILLLPVAGIVLVFATNRDRTVGQLLTGRAAWFNLVLLGATALSLRFRGPLSTSIDKRFFREAYDCEQMLIRLAESVKQLDSVAAIARLLSEELEAALHAGFVSVLYRDEFRPEFSVSYSTKELEGVRDLPDSAALVSLMEQRRTAQSWSELRASLPALEAAWLDSQQVDLLVPVLGADDRLLAIVLLGQKKSEEPYTRKDREMLQAVAAQIGLVAENLSLRERVRRERQMQADVLAKLESRQVNLVKECPACGACYDSSAQRCEQDGAELALTLPVERVIEGKYRLDRLVGKGGMGAVYQAQDLRLGRAVALKVMTGAWFGNAAAIRRFAREARASARLDHPNIVRVHDCGELGTSGAYLVMEFVTGATWRANLRRMGAFPPLVCAELMDQLLAGVEAAHRAHIIHRDLKPDNILIAGGTVKILDFGLAKVRETELADQKSLTVAGAVVGTLGYMSPEQLMGEEVDERTDIYALGVIAFEALTGELSLRGRGFHEQIERALAERFRFEGVTDQHREVARVVAGALAAKREDRTASVARLRTLFIPALRQCPAFPNVPAGRNPAPGEETRTMGTN